MDIRTFFVTQDREKSTDSVEGAAAQESIDSVEGEEPTVSVKQTTTHPVPSSSGCSGSTLSGNFPNNLLLPQTLYCCARLWWSSRKSLRHIETEELLDY